MQFIAITYRLGHSTTCGIINLTTRAIWSALSPLYLRMPSSVEFHKIENRFRTIWDFPNCLGAIDGKHVAIQCPSNAGSLYYNYKGFHSLVLMAACDAEYNLTMIDVGAYGRQNDAKTFSDSHFGQCIINRPSDFPSFVVKFNDNDHNLSGLFVAVDAFPLRSNILKPYSGHMLPTVKQVFNYRLSRPRRTIENVFGIMATKRRILRKPIIMEAKNADFVIKACCVLHNYVLRECAYSFRRYLQPDGELNDGVWRNEGLGEALRPIGVTRHGNISNAAHLVRDTFADYFMSEDGRVPWQFNAIGRGNNDL